MKSAPYFYPSIFCGDEIPSPFCVRAGVSLCLCACLVCVLRWRSFELRLFLCPPTWSPPAPPPPTAAILKPCVYTFRVTSEGCFFRTQCCCWCHSSEQTTVGYSCLHTHPPNHACTQRCQADYLPAYPRLPATPPPSLVLRYGTLVREPT